MGLRVALVNVPVHKISSVYGMGYQMPLWAVSIGGPLIDAGHPATLIDADVRGLTAEKICRELEEVGADVVMVGHPASTPAYKRVADTARYIKERLPHLPIIYGGVFPTFAYDAVMRQCEAVDFIVRGEGEATAVDLVNAIAAERRPVKGRHVSPFPSVDGIVWRRGSEIVVNRKRDLIDDLDQYRFGWELVDWDRYHMFKMGRSAAIQFSRGCSYRCGYCGQWKFWEKYRYRSPEKFIDELQLLREEYGVTHIAPSDEHFYAEREMSERMLEGLISRKLDVALYVNTTVKDVLRDRDLVPLYPKAGISFVTLGVESDSPAVQWKINKHNGFDQSVEAVRLLRQNRMVTLIHMIYGLENESWGTVARKIRAMNRLDADFFNLEYITPHFWTKVGGSTDPDQVIQSDLEKWDYRNQVLDVPGMKPAKLFWAVKASELIVHARPVSLARTLAGRAHPAVRGFRRRGWKRAFRVWAAEVAEFYRDRTLVATGEAPKKHPNLIKLGLGRPDADPALSLPAPNPRKVPPLSAFATRKTEPRRRLWECPRNSSART